MSAFLILYLLNTAVPCFHRWSYKKDTESVSVSVFFLSPPLPAQVPPHKDVRRWFNYAL